MAVVWMYTVASSSDPNKVKCKVPYRMNENLIFFGPCKKRIRKKLRGQYLRPERGFSEVVNDTVYIVGINGSNKEQLRKVVWAGKLLTVMTFAEAHTRLKGTAYQKLREDPRSPLHVSPKLINGVLVGYKHVSEYHSDHNDWVADLVSKSTRGNARLQGRSLTLKQGQTAWEVFDRDCCMLLENRFFAQGQGVDFDGEALKILKEAQPERSGIDDYAVFGLTKSKQVDGRKGNYLAIDGDLANRFIAWMESRSHKVASYLQDDDTESANKACTSNRSKRRC